MSGSQTCVAPQLPGTQAVMPASADMKAQRPVPGVHVEPPGHWPVAVHGAPHCRVAGWQTSPGVPRAHNASVAHWQNPRRPPVPGAIPSEVAHVFAVLGQSLLVVHEGMHCRVTGLQVSVGAQFASVLHGPAAPPAAAPPAALPPAAVPPPTPAVPPPVPDTFDMHEPALHTSVTLHERQRSPRPPHAVDEFPV